MTLNNIPVQIGEVLIDRYVIKQKLGKGHYSTCWLALDIKYNNYVAIKIKKTNAQNIEKSYDEVELLQAIEDNNFDEDWIKALKEYHKDDPLLLTELETMEHTQIVQLLNSFFYKSKDGEEFFCRVYEIMGINLIELIKKFNFKGIPLPYVRILAKQLLIGLDFLHRICHVIHTDLKPENIFLCLDKDELVTIQETEQFEVQESIKRENSESKSISNSYSNSADDLNYVISSNKLRAKIKQKMRQNKRLQKIGLSPQKNDEQLINDIPLYIDNDNDNDNDNNIEYKLEDLIERPRVLSVPKINININNKNDDDKNNNECYDDLDLMVYRNKIQNYIKEKNRIINDKKYRNKLIIKNKLLSQAKTQKEKIEVYKKLNKEYNHKEPIIDSDINIKINTFSNACRFNKHNNVIIQTRQYRSPEAILGINFTETTDMWSLACIIFELATGEYLFDPIKNANYSKNDDHLAIFSKILGKIPKNLIFRGFYSHIYFNKDGKFKKIKNIENINIEDILIKKYHFKEKEAKSFTDFIMPMLEYYPEKRATARQMLKHPWLKMPANFDYLMNDKEIEQYNINSNNNNNLLINISNTDDNNNDNELNKLKDNNSSHSELYKADDEDNSIYDDKEDEDDSGDENPDKIIISNYNNSFAEYGQFIDLTNLDRANPQFDQILKKEEDFI